MSRVIFPSFGGLLSTFSTVEISTISMRDDEG